MLSFRDWRAAILGVLLIGLLQDVLRKLTPGVPNAYIIWSASVFMIVAFNALLCSAFPKFKALSVNDNSVKFAWILFFAVVGIQILNSLLRFSTPVVAVFGALFYFGPIISLLLSVGYVDNEKRLRVFLKTYLYIFVPATLTVYLSPIFSDSFPVLREIGTFVGKELIIYDFGTMMLSFSGILRVGEIASWHAATCIFFLSIFAIQNPSRTKKIMLGLLIVLLVGAIILTGRRKMIVAVCIFYLVQLGLLAWIRWSVREVAVLLFVMILGLFVALGLFESTSRDSNLYLQRGASVFTSIDERWDTAVMLMKSAFNRSKGWGLGAGAGAQGVSYAGSDQSTYVGGSAESGLGKIMVELGVVGFLTICYLVAVIARRMFLNLSAVAKMGDRYLSYQVSFLSFIVANLAVFMIATQIFGDLFILIIIGMVMGFIFKIANTAIANPA